MQRIVSGEDIRTEQQKNLFGSQSQHHQAAAISVLEQQGSNTTAMDDAMSLSLSANDTNDKPASAIVVENDGGDVNDNDTTDSNMMMDDETKYNNSSSSNNNTVPDSSFARIKQQNTDLVDIVEGVVIGPTGIPRTDSRSTSNSATTFSSNGRQSSQNSSRDWGWFEDTHHSDHLQSGTVVDLSMGGVVDEATASQQQQKQQQQNLHRNAIKNTKKVDTSAVKISDTGGGGGGNSDSKGKIDETATKGASNSNSDRTQNKKSSENNNMNNRSGDEMLVDDMEEYLDPILVSPRVRDIKNEAAVQAVTAPNYVLEESLSDQYLWKDTAGNRPPQPVDERAFFEAMWAQNFAMSEVEYKMPKDVLTATTPVSLNPFADGSFGPSSAGTDTPSYNLLTTAPTADTVGGGKQDVAEAALVSRLNDPSRGIHSFVVPGTSGSGGCDQPHLQQKYQVVKSTGGSNDDLTVYTKGDNVFGTTVSKSFARPSVNGDLVTAVDTVNISVASYRVVESEKRGRHAQFLVIYREGSIRDTIGVWKRYSDFQELSNKVTKVHEGCTAAIANMSPLTVTEEHDVEHLPNAITSWHLLKKRKRWYRCLDPGYLSLKVFLLERFLHDILFESSSPDLLRDFVGVPPPK